MEESFSRLGFEDFSQIEYYWRYPHLVKRVEDLGSGIHLSSEPHISKSQVQVALSDLRGTISEHLQDNLYDIRNALNNPVLIMSKSGSKGSIINQVQMNSLLSQQTVNNRMI